MTYAWELVLQCYEEGQFYSFTCLELRREWKEDSVDTGDSKVGVGLLESEDDLLS